MPARPAPGAGAKPARVYLGLSSASSAVELALERALGDLLQVHVERRVDLEAALVDRVRAVALVQVQAHHLDEVGRAVVAVARRRDAQRRAHGAVELDLRDGARSPACCAAPSRGAPAPPPGGGAASRGSGSPGCPASSAHSRERQLLERLVEEGARRGLDAVGALAEVDLVEVHLEDLVLRVVALDLDRERDLLELARQRALVGEEQVAGELLGDRAAALRACAGAARC